MSSGEQTQVTSLQKLQQWFLQQALPIWTNTTAYDAAEYRFAERLDFRAQPVVPNEFRLMVQARQVATLARAHKAGVWADDGRLLAIYDHMRQRYRRTGGEPGWAFAIGPDHQVTSAQRDLYAHAFILYAIGCLYRAHKEPRLLADADEILGDIETIFARAPGYVSVMPAAGPWREQNPHMHLLEALLELFEASGQDRYLAGAANLFHLFRNQLVRTAPHVVRERYTDDWSATEQGSDSVIEPGHQFEWAWLLSKFQKHTGRDLSVEIAALVDFATRYGMDATTGAVFDSVSAKGTVTKSSTRVWVQTEAVRMLTEAGNHTLAARVAGRLVALHLPDVLRGGWFDRLTPDNGIADDFMPASTLYHLAGAVFDSSMHRPITA
ncbi:MAG TPA: AGE family epimerase/isomerase [Rhizomicrobium sp.]|jgi:mannose-6-phosphate isomerase|nr:AGE family epimerase/isomerase [Rhizomicrobium sp.]